MSSRQANSGLYRWLLLMTLWFAFALRLHRVEVQELRGDEAFAYFFSQQSLASLAQRTVQLREPHPIGSYVIARAWMGLAGDSVLAFRFPSVFAGVLVVALVYALARALKLPRGTGLAGSWAAAWSAYLVWHSQDARMYSMAAATELAVVWVGLRLLQRPRLTRWVGYVALAWLALHLHYYTLFVLVALNVYAAARLVARRLSRARALAWTLAQLTAALLYAPWAWYARAVFTAYRGTGESPPLGAMFWRSFSVLVVGESMTLPERRVYGFMGFVLVVAGLVSLARTRKAGKWTALLLGCLLGVPLVSTWLAAWQRPLFNERYLVLAAPPFYLLMGVVVTWPLTARWDNRDAVLRTFLGIALTLAYMVGNGVALYRYFYDPRFDKVVGWRELAAVLDRWSRPMPPSQVRLAQNYPDPSLWYYYRGPVAHLVLPPKANDETAARAAVQDLVREGVAWVMLPVQPSPVWDADGVAERALAEAYTLVWQTRVAVWPVHLYARPLPDAWRGHDIAFANGVRLLGVQVQPQTLRGGVPLVVHTRWAMPNGLQQRTKAFVHLVPEAGPLTPLAQCDPELPTSPGEHTVSCAFLVPATLPPGTYRLLLGLYLPDLAHMPRVPTVDGQDAVPGISLQFP